MAKYQVSPNLINNLRILLRKEAAFESFNPEDPSLLPPQTLDEAIARFGPSVDHLLCKHCNGVLLRGSDSIICVYCGHGQQQECPPQPIRFKSTIGFGWLMQSLGLDGSEIIGPSTGGGQSNRGQNLKDEISLSDFLDLELTWPDESKRFGVTNEAQFPGKRSLNFVGEDFDDLSPEGRIEHASHVHRGQVVTSEKIESKAGESNLSLFENKKPSEATLRSDEGENDESSAWEAEFQSAVPHATQEHLQSFNDSKKPLDEYAAHVGSIIRPVDQEQSANISISDASSSNLTNNELLFPSKQSENILGEAEEKVFESVNSSSSFDWSLDNQRKTTIADPLHDNSRFGDDPFDEWKDRVILTASDNNQCEPSGTTLPGTESGEQDKYDDWNDCTGSVSAEHSHNPTNGFLVPNDDSLATCTTSSTTEDIQLQTRSIDISKQEKHHDLSDGGGNDFSLLNGAGRDQQDIHVESTPDETSTQGDSIGLCSTNISSAIQGDILQGREIKLPASGTTKEVDDSFDFWNDFKSSAVEHDSQKEGSIQDDLLQGREIKSPASVTTKEVDGSFDFWNDFKSSTVELESQQKENIMKVADMAREGDSFIDVQNDFLGVEAGKNEQEISSTKKAVDSKKNSSRDDSFASWNDDSFDAWNDYTGVPCVSDSNPISNDLLFGAWNGFSSATVTHDSQNQISGTKAAENQTILEDDSLFSSWNDVRSPGTQVEHSFSSPNVAESTQDQVRAGKAPENLAIMKDDSPFNSWGDFVSSSPCLEKQSQAGEVELSEDKATSLGDDFFIKWSNISEQSSNPPNSQSIGHGVTILDGKSTGENDDSFDAWTDFTSSSNVQANSWLSASANAPDNEEVVKHDGTFDEWNVFVSSSNVQAGNDTAFANGSKPEINLFSPSTNLQGVGPNSSLSSDPFLSMFSDQNGSAQVADSPPEVPDLVRTVKGDVKADDGYSEKINQCESASGGTIKPSDVETLISEMHDLSFMLESSLSIPTSHRRKIFK